MKAPSLYQYACKEKLNQIESEFNNEKRLVLEIHKAVLDSTISEVIFEKPVKMKFDIDYFRQMIDDLICYPHLYSFEVCPSALILRVTITTDIQSFENDIHELYREFIKIK